MFAIPTPRSRSALAVAVVAVVVGVSGIAITAEALLAGTPARPPKVTNEQAGEKTGGIPAALELDVEASRPVVGLLDSLRRMDRQPRDVDWMHFRCVEAATVLSSAHATREEIVGGFGPTWTRVVGKEVDVLRSSDGRVEIAIPAPGGRDKVDELVFSLRPERVVAVAYHLRPC